MNLLYTFAFTWLYPPSQMSERKKIVIQARNAPPHLPPQPVSADSWDHKPNSVVTLPRHLFLMLCAGVLLMLMVLLGLLIYLSKSKVHDVAESVLPDEVAPTQPVSPDILNIDLSKYTPEKDVVGADLPLRAYLEKLKLSDPVVRELLQQASDKGIERLEKGHEVMALTHVNGDPDDRLFLYEISPNKSLLFRLNPLPRVEVKLKQVENRERAAGGVIKTSLWEAVLDYNIHYRVIEQMEEAMKWSVDFYHLEPGDKFKVIYEEKRAGNEIIGIGKMKAVYFKTGGKELYAFFVEGVEKSGFYDEAGRPVQKTFLKCPVKYERVTSYYDPARLHPVTGTVKPHFGTDFAAPQGSPIFAVADGTVEVADFTKNNGNYIKLRHDLIFETQYLHMSRFEPGIQPGTPVKQGQVIGYVGQTGLATGPHVCFRFWKDGVQVDPRDEPENRPFFMSLKDQERYLELKNSIGQQLREIVYYDGRL